MNMPITSLRRFCSYAAFTAIFISLISQVVTATLPLPKPKLSRSSHTIKCVNHF